MKVLILVDIQNDFLPGGALAVPHGDEVVPVANRVAASFELVVATQDWHPADHGSFAANHEGRAVGDVIDLDGLEQILWPVHCVQGSVGTDFAAGLDLSVVERVFRKGTNPVVDSYSGFFDNGRRQDTGLDEFLKEHGVDEVYVMGLATDYCVQCTALHAVELGYATRLIEDGCRGVELQPGDVAAAIESMREAGVEIVGSADVAT